MPIRGLSDKSSITPRFPRLGKLRKGGEMVEKVNKSGVKVKVMGPDLDHFRFTSDSPEIVNAFEEVYGKDPKSIVVYLPYASEEENFPTWCEVWGSSGLVHRCDGENMTIWLEGDHYVKGSKPCMGGHKDNDPLKDGIGRLNVIIPELIQAGYVGYVTVESHSKNDIISIMSVLSEALQSRGNNPLGLRGIPFNLRRVQENISMPGWGDRKGQRSRTDKWLIKIEPVVEWVKLQLDLDRQRAMLLPTGDDKTESAANLPEDLQQDDQIPEGEVEESEIDNLPDAEDTEEERGTAKTYTTTTPKTTSKTEHNLAWARTFVTPRGKSFTIMSPEEWQSIIVTKDPKITPDMKEAAQLLMNQYEGV